MSRQEDRQNFNLNLHLIKFRSSPPTPIIFLPMKPKALHKADTAAIPLGPDWVEMLPGLEPSRWGLGLQKK